MQSKLTISCNCAKIIASVNIDEKKTPTRIKCYCIDCQTYARHLDAASTQLDENGGTDILQISPATFSIQHGQEHLGNLTLSPNGIYRWHSTCCNTPLCNTPANADMPYLGLLTNNITKFVSTEKTGGNGKSTKLNDDNRHTLLNEHLGPVKRGVGAGDKHPMSADWPIAKGFGVLGLLGTLRNMARWRLRGDHKRSMLIDATSGEPLVKPLVLTLEQRQNAQSKT